ncbi:MAG: tetratricopeptide repeat protein [Alphaproteobacteria bacterium]|nr:tetratricopeptide repeat protein [Alphaproteobacteria bacterium]MCB9791297.1 tetratricopeptide repeat protein [Alphaproteobacteria bacterium]
MALKPVMQDTMLARVRVDDVLGEGGMGRVLSGVHLPTGVPVAVKVLTPEGLLSSTLRMAFENEVRAVAALNHVGIIPILDYGEVGAKVAAGHPELLPAESPFLVMPMARGGTAWSLYGRLSWPRLVRMLERLLDALAHAHARDVLHRDLKPSNILLHAPGEPDGLWLTDFGLADLDAERYPQAQPLLGGGTGGYHAPEQNDPRIGPQGPWTDLYGLGRVALVLSQGVQAPSSFMDWVAWLTEDDPAQRPCFAAEAARALEGIAKLRPRAERWVEEPVRSIHGPEMGLAALTLRQPRFVGREAERELLWAELEEARSSQRPRAVRLESVAGLGRSRLATWIADEAHEMGLARAMRVRLTRERVGADPVAEALGKLLGLNLRLPCHARLEAQLPDFSEDERGRLLEWMRAPTQRGVAVRVRRDQDRVALLRRAILTAAQACPLVLVLDDVHLDPGAALLAKALLNPSRAEGAALLVVLTTPSPLPDADAPHVQALLESPEITRIHLGPLPRHQHLALVRDLLGRRLARLGEVMERSEGDPGFAVQLVRGLVESPGPDAPLPDSLADVYTRRALLALRRVSLESRRSAFMAAILGVEPELELWRASCREAGISPRRSSLHTLTRAGLLSSGVDSARFCSSVARETLLQLAALEGEAPALHLAVSRALPRAERAARAEHLIAAGHDAEAVPLLAQALRRGLREQLPGHTLDRWAERWTQLRARLRQAPDSRWLLLGDLCVLRVDLQHGRREHARGRCDGLLRRAAALGELELELQSVKATVLGIHREPEAQLALLLELEAKAEGELRGRAQQKLAGLYIDRGELDEAARWARAAITTLEGSPAHATRLEATRSLAITLGMQSRFQEMLTLLESLQRDCQAQGLQNLWGLSLSMSGVAHYMLGDLEAAEQAYLRSLEIAEDYGNDQHATAWHNLGWVRYRLGRPLEARELLERSMRVLNSPERAPYRALRATCLAVVHATLGDWEAIPPEWREVDVTLLAKGQEELLAELERVAQAASAGGHKQAAETCWVLLRRAAEASADPARVAKATEGLARLAMRPARPEVLPVEVMFSSGAFGLALSEMPTKPATEV